MGRYNIMKSNYPGVPLPTGKVIVCSEDTWLRLNEAARISPQAVAELMDDPDFEGGFIATSQSVDFGVHK